MKKINNLLKTLPNIKLICWDLDGTLLDTEKMWYDMDELVKQSGKSSEDIAAEAYKTWGYRANGEKALNYFKDNQIKQVIINKCDLTNQSMLKNETINQTFPFTKFASIISEKSFTTEFTDEDMYQKALKDFNINDNDIAIAICDLPFELKAAKNSGLTTIWAKNVNYPFTKDEEDEIKSLADYYVEDFTELIK